MTLLIATICMQIDALTLQCRTEVVRVEPTLAACARMIEATEAWLVEAYAPEWMAVGCKQGTMG